MSTRRPPIVATALVAVAVAAMIALGLWQLLDRRPQKLAELALLAQNPRKPAIAFPGAPDQALLFRHAYGECRPPVTITLAGAGAQGFRAIARCAAGAMMVQLGTTRDPTRRVAWEGGAVSGTISQAPDPRPLIALVFDRKPRALMLIADPPLMGLAANPRPDPAAIPNNHLSYAVQWFLFAATALVIYALALRKKRKPPAGARD